ncbi:MAG: 4-hydroxy-tetrahydrodipicolinate reductase [Candidatus Omnitrophica bacterium]|nr:4-hydroxy-tetrahydrodipicolinate reductase [Candidatus Omnitrophota bacterium]
MIKLCVGGSKGKMGSRIIELAKENKGFEVTGEFDIGDDPKSAIESCDCLIEFTSPEATIEHLRICREFKKPVVIGTTGLSPAQIAEIEEASKEIPVALSPNMSIGVNLLFKMVSDAAKVLGHGYTIQIVEAHHEHKKDAPSGTAKEIARIVKDARGGGDVPIDSIREGEIVGEHTVTFDSELDMIEITHSAKTRDIFARGALTAAKFAAGKPAGLYSMKDVLGL